MPPYPPLHACELAAVPKSSALRADNPPALHIAAQRQHVAVDQLDKAGWSAMMWAAAGNHVEVVDYLINSGGSVEPREGDWNPLMVAAASGSSDVLNLLLQRGIDFTDVNHESKSAAMLARENGFVDMADRLDRMTDIRRRHEDL